MGADASGKFRMCRRRRNGHAVIARFARKPQQLQDKTITRLEIDLFVDSFVDRSNRGGQSRQDLVAYARMLVDRFAKDLGRHLRYACIGDRDNAGGARLAVHRRKFAEIFAIENVAENDLVLRSRYDDARMAANDEENISTVGVIVDPPSAG